MENRINKLRNLMYKKGLENFLILDEISRLYLSGFKSSKGAILIAKNNIYLFLASKYISEAKEKCKNFIVLNEESDFINVIKKEKIKEVGIWEESINIKLFNDIKKSLNIDIKFSGNLVGELRKIKDENEIKLIKKACEYTDEIYLKLIKYLKRNTNSISEKDISNFIEIEIIKRGLKNSFDIIVASGKNGAKPHHRATKKIIEEGDFVTVDFGVIYKGYRSDMTRTFIYKKNTNELLTKIYNVVKEAQNLGVRNSKCEMKEFELDFLCRKHIEESGYGENFVHGTGHGIGLEGHEYINLNRSFKNTIKENMVITIEPGIYIENLGGVRIEDTIVIRNGENEVLTKAPKELIIV